GDGRRQLALQGAQELGAGDGLGGWIPLAADEDDGVGQGVGAGSYCSCGPFCSHRPGSNNCVASTCYSFQETSPTCRTYAFLLHFALLEGIINRCWIRF